MKPEVISDTLMHAIGIAVFELRSGGRLQVLCEPPDWLTGLAPDCRAGAEIQATLMPVLEGFLFEANQHWMAGRTEALVSEAWVESLRDGTDTPLEATAVASGDSRLIVVQQVGQRFERSGAILQGARETLLIREELEIEVRRRTEAIRSREEEILHRLLQAATQHDEETGAHNRRLGLYSAEMALALGWPPERVDDLRIAAPMHDIGKIGIPDTILRKPGQFDPQERIVMERHAAIGFEILTGSEIPALELAAEIAFHHHERWDGSGYPRGLEGKNIPLSARIVSITDFFDALSNARVYKPAFPQEEVLAELEAASGSFFDPELVELFMHLMPKMQTILAAHPDTGS